jgi:hypothetical protein
MQPKKATVILLASFVLFFTLLTIASATGHSTLPVKRFFSIQHDTTRPDKSLLEKKQYQEEEIELALKAMDQAKVTLDKSIKIDKLKMKKEIEKAMAEMKKIDVDKIKEEITVALNKVDWDEINNTVKKALNEASVNMNVTIKEEIRKEMKKLKKELKTEKLVNVDEINADIEKELTKAKKELDKSTLELKKMKAFTDMLEKDGVINQADGYQVDIKEGEFYINGNKQSKEITEKYKAYFPGNTFSIKHNGKKITGI